MERINPDILDGHKTDHQFKDGKPFVTTFTVKMRIGENVVEKKIKYDFEKLSYAKVSAAIQAFTAYDEMETNPPKTLKDLKEAFLRETEQAALSIILLDSDAVLNGTDEYNPDFKETVTYKALNNISGSKNIKRLEMCKTSFFYSAGLISTKSIQQSENTIQQLINGNLINPEAINKMIEGNFTLKDITESIGQTGTKIKTKTGV